MLFSSNICHDIKLHKYTRTCINHKEVYTLSCAPDSTCEIPTRNELIILYTSADLLAQTLEVYNSNLPVHKLVNI